MSLPDPQPTGRPRPTRRRATLALCLIAACVSFALACRAIAVAPPVMPVASGASAAFEEARAWARSSEPLARARTRAALQSAVDLDAGWIAPQRMLDILASEDLLGLDALATHRAALALAPDDPRELYLAGRLEGALGAARFERAARVAPDLAWAQHGLGYVASLRRDPALALRHARRALDLARDPWERTYFTQQLARYHLAGDQSRRALDVLQERADEPTLAPSDRVELEVQLASIELTLVFQPEYARGWERAQRLLRERDLTDAEVGELVTRMRFLRTSESASLELQLALGSRPGAARDRARAELLLDQRPSPLALGLLRRGLGLDDGDARAGPLLRAARFAAGQFRLGVEEWLADLPGAVLDLQGRPCDERLASVVDAARALPAEPDADRLATLGEGLLAAGWFREARAVAATLAIHDLDRALALEDHAAACQQFIADVQRLLDGTQAVSARVQGAPKERRIDDLGTLLNAMAAPLARAHAVIGGELDEPRLAAWLEASPRLEYGPFASIVHPGPSFSAADAAARLGTRGAEVGGLAELLASLGRFGIFGELLGGGGPDGTILPRLRVATRSGEHLGVPWSGTVAWCEGADVRSRAGRLGAEISGAALHEGYWVDIDSLRRERAPWDAFQREFFVDGDPQRVQRALSSRGLELATPRERADERRSERRDASILLGEADRVRLAVLAERGAGTGMTLDELLEVTAVHEEGHLCDRERFVPLSDHVLRALQLFARVGFNPSKIAQRLEYRAQLTALCDTSDPRLPLVAVLRGAESGSGELTPHASAYRDLLVDLLATLDRRLEREPAAWSAIDPDYVLAHQLHWLRPEALRVLARELARREGLFER